MLALALGLAQTLHAQMVVDNDYFVVNFLNTDSWGDYSSDTQLENIKAGVQGAIDYWGSLLGENHRPLTGEYPKDPFTGETVREWERRVVIDFSFNPTNSALASTAAQTMIYSDKYFDNPALTVPNGTSYNKVSRAELKLKTDGNFPLSLVSDETTDMSIVFGPGGFDGAGFTFDGIQGSGYDFQTIFLHEMTHGMGFESDAYGTDGYSDNGNKTALDASMGSSIDATPGSELAVWDRDEKGNLVKVATLVNPSGGFEQGEHIVHIDHDFDETKPLMRQSISVYDPVQREFTMADIAVLEAMGWNLTVPDSPDAPVDVAVGDGPYRAQFATMEGGSGNSVYTLTGLTIADGKINESLTLQLQLTAEQLHLFQEGYKEGNIIGFALDGITLEEFNASGISYNDITLRIGGVDYKVLGKSEYTPFGSTTKTAILYVPEPSTAALSLLALAGLLVRRRRAQDAI